MLSPTLTWTAELGQAFRRLPDLLAYLGLEASDAPEIQSVSDFPLLVPRPFASRMRKGDWKDPLLAQVLPLLHENAVLPGFCSDAVGDMKAQGAPGLLHKYGNRVLLLPTSLCAIHCRYCFRRHYPYAELPKARDAWDEAWQYLTSPQGAEVEEVILSGGDPLSLDNSRLGWFWERVVALPQIRSVRLHTRLPVVLPARIDTGFIELATRMTAEKPGVLVLHANHAHELDGEVAEACARLRQAGLVLLNQSVLLRGVNDSVAALKGLSQRLLEIGVMPYYLHLLDRVQGAAHFEVPEAEALSLLSSLREHVQGYLVPRLVREIAGEPAKTVVA